MLSRREFLRNSALIAAGVIAADQLEILDRLAPRSLFASAGIPQVKEWSLATASYGASGFSIGDSVVIVMSSRERLVATVTRISPLTFVSPGPRRL